MPAAIKLTNQGRASRSNVALCLPLVAASSTSLAMQQVITEVKSDGKPAFDEVQRANSEYARMAAPVVAPKTPSISAVNVERLNELAHLLATNDRTQAIKTVIGRKDGFAAAGAEAVVEAAKPGSLRGGFDEVDGAEVPSMNNMVNYIATRYQKADTKLVSNLIAKVEEMKVVAEEAADAVDAAENYKVAHLDAKLKNIENTKLAAEKTAQAQDQMVVRLLTTENLGSTEAVMDFVKGTITEQDPAKWTAGEVEGDENKKLLRSAALSRQHYETALEAAKGPQAEYQKLADAADLACKKQTSLGEQIQKLFLDIKESHAANASA